MGQKLEGDHNMWATAADVARSSGFDPLLILREDRSAMQSWLNFVKGHPRAVDCETAKDEEGAPPHGLDFKG